MTRKKIALFGGGLNPPGMHHLNILFEALLFGFEIIIVPSGNDRPDKTITSVSPEQRITLMHLGFKFFLGSGVVRLDLTDLERGVFTRTHELQERYEAEGEIWHLLGADWIIGGRSGRSRIQLEWFLGKEIWETYNLAISRRAGYQLIPEDLPPNCILLSSEICGQSSEIRTLRARGESITGLVVPEVEEYILRNGLYLPKGERR